MKTIKQFLEEALTSPYEHHYTGIDPGKYGDTHHYWFRDHKNKPFAVQIYNHKGEKKKGTAEISFEDSTGSIGKTGKAGRHAVRIFSTVKAVMKDHAERHPDVNRYIFSALKNPDDERKGKVDTKERLYSTLAKVHGGKKTGDTNFFSDYEVPVKREK